MRPVPRDVTVLCSLRRFSINKRKVVRFVREIGGHCGFDSFQVHVTFVGPARIRKLNKKFRQKDRSTDVLSFPIQSWKTPVTVRSRAVAAKARALPNPLGDIFISVEDALHNAKALQQPLSRELGFLLIHGFLHLCGHDHMNPRDEKVMLAAQRRILRVVGVAPGASWTRLVAPIKNKTFA